MTQRTISEDAEMLGLKVADASFEHDTVTFIAADKRIVIHGGSKGARAALKLVAAALIIDCQRSRVA